MGWFLWLYENKADPRRLLAIPLLVVGYRRCLLSLFIKKESGEKELFIPDTSCQVFSERWREEGAKSREKYEMKRRYPDERRGVETKTQLT